MKRILVVLYGGLTYVLFFSMFIALIAFLENRWIPFTVDNNASSSQSSAILINISLILLFGIQHTIMARAHFKRWLTQYIPNAVERSTFVLVTSVVLVLIITQWQALPQVIWSAEGLVFWILEGFVWLGWGIVVLVSFLINHFELFGLTQVFREFRQKSALVNPQFVSPFLYQFVRHPMQTGFLMAFWLAPHMTVGRLLFAAGMTIYILIGLHFEEKALMREFGEEYALYRQTTPKLLPRIRFN